MRDSINGHIVILDWGFSVYRDDGPQSFAGGLECSADDVLNAVKSQRAIIYHPRFDLISLVRMLYMSIFGNDEIEKLDLGKEEDNDKKKTHVESIIDYWQDRCCSSMWNDISSYANACNYSQLISKLEELF
jgi:hypothetical protein